MSQAHKTRLDRLFLLHATISVVIGALAYIFPGLFAFLLGGEFKLHHSGAGKLMDLTIRLYGALLIGGGFIVYKMRNVTDGEVRRGIVQGCAGIFIASGLALGRSHFTDETIPLVNIFTLLLMWMMAAFYTHFAVFSPPPIFEGLDRVIK